MEDRVILHCDCNSFFASVETVLNPFYRDVPMAVCGDPEDRHGIVLAKNELAKQYGIKTADTVYSAKRACPNLVIARPHYDEYVKYSRLVNAIYSDYTELIEPFGIDESWLDVTASRRLFGSGLDIANTIRERVKRELGITISVGVSFNKVFAKLGSDYKKPDAVTFISRENMHEIVYPLPVGQLLFIGNKTEEILNSVGVRTIGDLARASEALLTNKLGKAGSMLINYARGDDCSPVLPLGHRDDAKSVGNGFTFKHNLVRDEDIRMGIDYLTAEIGRRLRANEQLCTTVSVAIKDEFLRVSQKQRQLSSPSDIGAEIADVAYEIARSFWAPGKPIRTITVTASGLIRNDSSPSQFDVFGANDDGASRDKQRRVEEALDSIRARHGGGAMVRGGLLDNDIGIVDSTSKK